MLKMVCNIIRTSMTIMAICMLLVLFHVRNSFMIKGLFETHINVTSLERSMKFYGEVLGLELGRYEEGRMVAFYWLGKWVKQCSVYGKNQKNRFFNNIMLFVVK